MTVYDSVPDPFSGLDSLSSKLENRVKRRRQLLQKITDGNFSEAKIEAKEQNIDLFDAQQIPPDTLDTLESQIAAIKAAVAEFEASKAQLEQAQSIFDTIDFKGKFDELNRVLLTDKLQQADLALYQLDFTQLSQLLENARPFTTNLAFDDPLLKWFSELEKDHSWIDTTNQFISSEFNNLKEFKQTLIDNQQPVDNRGWQNLQSMQFNHSQSRLLKRYLWLDLLYREKAAGPRYSDYNISTPLHDLVAHYLEKKPHDELSIEFSDVANLMRQTLKDPFLPDAMKQLGMPLLMAFEDTWQTLISETAQFQATLPRLGNFILDHANLEQSKMSATNLAAMIHNSHTATIHVHADSCTKILTALERALNVPENLETTQLEYVKGLKKIVVEKSHRGARLLKEWSNTGNSSYNM